MSKLGQFAPVAGGIPRWRSIELWSRAVEPRLVQRVRQMGRMAVVAETVAGFCRADAACAAKLLRTDSVIRG